MCLLNVLLYKFITNELFYPVTDYLTNQFEYVHLYIYLSSSVRYPQLFALTIVQNRMYLTVKYYT